MNIINDNSDITKTNKPETTQTTEPGMEYEPVL